MKNKKFLTPLRNLSIKLKTFFLKDSFILFFLGIFSSFSLPPFNFFFINFFFFCFLFIFLFKKLNKQTKKKFFFFYGWVFGFGYFLTNLYWITISLTFEKNFDYLIPVALILIPSFLAIFYGFVSLIFYLFNFKNVMSSFFLFCLLFGLTEFIRGNILTGFPWNLIVYSFSNSLTFLSFLSILGTYSFNLVVISIFSVPAIYILRKSRKEIFILIFFLLLPTIFFSYGVIYKKNFLSNEVKRNPYLIRVIGSNISLDRYYTNTNTESVINELIRISSPDQNIKTFFFMA